jgi:hypothetical protein
VTGFASAAAAGAGLVPNSASREAGASPAAGFVPKSSSRELGASPAAGFAGGFGGISTSVPSM